MNITQTSELAKHLIQACDPVVAAKNSYFSYHAEGVNYVCLLRDRSLTAKLYVVDPLEWEPNQDGWLVNPHDHAYDFQTVVLAGAVRNFLFQDGRGEVLPAGVRPLGAFQRFWYSSRPRKFSAPQDTELLLLREDCYKADQAYYMDHLDIHTIAPSRKEVTVMLLLQYRTMKCQTLYWGRDHEAPDLSDLYEPMHPKDVEDFLKYVREILGY